MAINLRVSLDKTYKPWAVDVDETGKANRVNSSNIKRQILWKLIDDAAAGKFHALDDANPGFKWITAPPYGVFGEPILSDDRKQLSITDLNDNTESKGEFIYQLFIEIDGVSYSTVAALGMRAATNPAIINR